MRAIFSFLFDRITDPLGLPIHIVWEYLLLLVIGELAYRISYSAIGDMYRDGSIHSKGAGRLLHWIIRTIIYFTAWAITYCVITVGVFVTNNWKTVLLVGGIITFILITVAISLVIVSKNKRKKAV